MGVSDSIRATLSLLGSWTTSSVNVSIVALVLSPPQGLRTLELVSVPEESTVFP